MPSLAIVEAPVHASPKEWSLNARPNIALHSSRPKPVGPQLTKLSPVDPMY